VVLERLAHGRHPDEVPADDAIFFTAPAELRAWFEEHHATADELWVGYHKKATKRPTITWSEAVDEALCFGWIDGKLQRIDDERHRQRFTPRRKGSNWSEVNIANVAKLRAEGRMTPAGEAAFAARPKLEPGALTYERRHEAAFDTEQQAAFRANERAWTWFEEQSPSYRQLATYWVLVAKRPETRARRLGLLIDCSAEGRRVPALQS
jgi:uncharacterized protein YdeI (YjbR/CyaY-like superfamily)